MHSRIQQEDVYLNHLLQEVCRNYLQQEANLYYQMDVDNLKHHQEEVLLKQGVHLLGLLQFF